MPLVHTKEELDTKIRKTLHLQKEELLTCQIVKKSIDARRKPENFIIYTIDVAVKKENQILQRMKSGKSCAIQIQESKDVSY